MSNPLPKEANKIHETIQVASPLSIRAAIRVETRVATQAISKVNKEAEGRPKSEHKMTRSQLKAKAVPKPKLNLRNTQQSLLTRN